LIQFPFSDLCYLVSINLPDILGENGGAIRKPDAAYRMMLCFPDMYEIGMSNNAMRILYAAINDLEGLLVNAFSLQLRILRLFYVQRKPFVWTGVRNSCS
jgi:hypothetical protein